jgi:hypothetical protein
MSPGGALRAVACRRLPCALKVASAAPQPRLLVACSPVRLVSGGIVADSTPAGELAETWDQAHAFSRVLA